MAIPNNDIILDIFQSLPRDDLDACQFVCQSWNHLITTSTTLPLRSIESIEWTAYGALGN